MAGQRMVLSLPFLQCSRLLAKHLQGLRLYFEVCGCQIRTRVVLFRRDSNFKGRNLMAEASQDLEGPDFEKGCDIDKMPDGGMLLGHAFGEAVLVARRGRRAFCHRRDVHALRGPAGKRFDGGLHRALPMAPCAF